MAKTVKDAQLQAQAEEIERLRTELDDMKKGGEAVYPLPHTLRKGVGDLWRGYVPGRERPDNLPGVQPGENLTPPIMAVSAPTGPSNQEILEFMAAKAINEAQAEG